MGACIGSLGVLLHLGGIVASVNKSNSGLCAVIIQNRGAPSR